MPYVVAPGSIMNITFQGFLHGQEVMTSMHYFLSSEAGEDGGNAIGEARVVVNTVGTGLYRLWLNCMSNQVIDIAQFFQWITPTRFAYQTFEAALRTGSIDEEAQIPNIAQVVTRRGELAGRHNVSNLHLPGLPTGRVDSGFLTNAQLTELQAFVTKSCEVIPLASGAVLKACAFNRAAPASSALLVQGYVQPTSREMRRRTVGLGS